MKNQWLILIGCCALAGMGNQGCEQVPTDTLPVVGRVPTPTNRVEEVTARFTVTSKGKFRAGFDDSEREIFIMKDSETGDEYLGITDCTLIKHVNRHKED